MEASENPSATSVERRIGGATLALVQGDITRIRADAIVNAANSALAGGGGVDGAIHRAGGPRIMAELRSRHGGCPTGHAVATTAGDLPASWVIHAVGPVWAGGGRGEPGLLAAAYESAFDRAEELGARSMTLPAISCGIYGYPLDDGAAVAVQAVARRLAAGGTVERATFVLFSEATFRAFRDALEALNPAA